MLKKTVISNSAFVCLLHSCAVFLCKKHYKSLHNAIDRALAAFEIPPKRSIRWRLIYDRFRYQIEPDEYFMFGFANLNANGKREYIGSYERKELVHRLTLRPDDRTRVFSLTQNKYLTYLLLKDYYRREILLLNKEDDLIPFVDFLNRKENLILKPQGASLGDDVRLIRLSEIPDVKAFFDELMKVRSWIVEEIVVQAEEMAGFHPQSLNTVRLVTLLFRGDVVFLFGCLRMGTGDSVVDNTAQGGLGAAIDVDTGIVISAGMDKKGHSFLLHPDTGKQIIGFSVPRYEELKEMTVKLAKLLSEMKYVAWDCALTPKGWCLIEANSAGHLTNQAREKRGYRRMFEQYYLQ